MNFLFRKLYCRYVTTKPQLIYQKQFDFFFFFWKWKYFHSVFERLNEKTIPGLSCQIERQTASKQNDCFSWLNSIVFGSF